MEIIKRNPNVTSALIGDEVCLFEPDNAEYIILNQSGSHIWELIKDEKYDVDQLINNLLEIFEVDKDICESQTRNFISDALTKGILISVNKNET